MRSDDEDLVGAKIKGSILRHLDRAEHCYTTFQIEQGRNLMLAGEPTGEDVYVVLSGVLDVLVSYSDPLINGKSFLVPVRRFTDGDLIGELEQAAGLSSRVSTVQTVSQCRLCRVSINVKAEASKNEKFRLALEEQLNVGYKRAKHMTVPALSKFVLDLADYGNDPERSDYLPRFDRTALGERLGISQESISLVLRRFRERGIIRGEPRNRRLPKPSPDGLLKLEEMYRHAGAVPAMKLRPKAPEATTRVIGVVLPNVNTFWVQALTAEIESAEKRGYRVLVSHTADDILREAQEIRDLRNRVDGVVVSARCLEPDEITYADSYGLYLSTGKPLIFFDRYVRRALEEHESVGLVQSNNRRIGRQATEHLLHSLPDAFPICFMRENPEMSAGILRCQGWMDALLSPYKNSASYPVRYLHSAEIYSSGYVYNCGISLEEQLSNIRQHLRTLVELLSGREEHPAFFCVNDILATRLLDVLREPEFHALCRGHDPNKLIAGVDRFPDSTGKPPPFFSVAQFPGKMGRTAISALVSMLERPSGEVVRQTYGFDL